MKRFLKDNSYNMVKLFLNQIGISVFGTMLALATSKSSLHLAASILSILFFLYLNYVTAWEMGAKDKLRIGGARLKYMPEKGLWLALGANLPNIVIALTMGISAMIGTDGGKAVAGIMNLAARLLNGMYLGSIVTAEKAVYGQTGLPLYTWWWFIVIIIPSLIVGWFSYLMGVKNISIMKKLGLSSPNNNKK